MNTPPPTASRTSNERGAALVASILILLVLSVITSSLFWISQSEMSQGQAFAQGVRALYLAETGMARFFSSASGGSSVDTAADYTYFADPCTDTLRYPTAQDQSDCYDDGEDEPEWVLTDFVVGGLSDESYDFTDAQVSVRSQQVMVDGGTPIYEVTVEASVQDPQNADLVTSRAVKTYAQGGGSSFAGNAMFVPTGGALFDDYNGAHYHLSTDEPAAGGSCGGDGSTPITQVPNGTFELVEDKWGDCPYTDACTYDWHESGAGVDSSATTGSELLTEMGIDWTELMSDSYYAGLPNVIEFTSSSAFETYFDPSRESEFLAMENWPISRVTGDPELFLNKDIKGFGLLIVDGPMELTGGSTVIEWTGMILVGGHFEAYAKNHFHLNGGMITGIDCTDFDRSKGWCEAVFGNAHTEMTYRPCAIARATAAFSSVRRLDDLFREGSPGS